jgi:hypothetical protein
MMITRKAMHRRTVLRGAGATIALPLLEAMGSSAMAVEAATASRKRLQVIYTPNGMVMNDFFPKETGAGYTMSPILKPLEAYRDRFAVISGLDHVQAEALGDGAGDHARCCGTFLTGVHVKKTDGAGISNGVSMDQIVAKQFAELGLESPSLVGSCDSGYSCAYTNTLSWSGEASPMPITTNPREVFERLFGENDLADAKSRLVELKRQASILDLVAQDAKRLSVSLGADDKKKVDEYMTSIRDLERGIQKLEQRGAVAMPTYARPAGIPDNFQEYARMMIDLQILAMQADLTRVGTFMIGREGSNNSYPEINVADAHHPISHHGNDPEKLAKLSKINTLHMEQVAYYLKRMSETKEGEGSLLDTTIFLAGAGLADPNEHNHRNLPLIVGGGAIKGNRHFNAKDVPMTNLMLSMMDELNVKVEKLGDSTGRLSGLI